MRTYTITVTEKDQGKARRLRTMLRNYGGREILPGLFVVTLTPNEYRTLTQAARRLRIRGA